MNWNELKEPSDIQALLERFGYFHDSCLSEVHISMGIYVNEDLAMGTTGNYATNVTLQFQRQYTNPSAIDLLFEGVTDIHLNPIKENEFPLILDAILLKHDQLFYWFDSYDINVEDRYNYQCNWIAGKKLKWRDASDDNQ